MSSDRQASASSSTSLSTPSISTTARSGSAGSGPFQFATGNAAGTTNTASTGQPPIISTADLATTGQQQQHQQQQYQAEFASHPQPTISTSTTTGSNRPLRGSQTTRPRTAQGSANFRPNQAASDTGIRQQAPGASVNSNSNSSGNFPEQQQQQQSKVFVRRRACEPCRSRKAKCDLTAEPPCSECIKRGEECVFLGVTRTEQANKLQAKSSKTSKPAKNSKKKKSSFSPPPNHINAESPPPSYAPVVTFSLAASNEGLQLPSGPNAETDNVLTVEDGVIDGGASDYIDFNVFAFAFSDEDSFERVDGVDGLGGADGVDGFNGKLYNLTSPNHQQQPSSSSSVTFPTLPQLQHPPYKPSTQPTSTSTPRVSNMNINNINISTKESWMHPNDDWTTIRWAASQFLKLEGIFFCSIVHGRTMLDTLQMKSPLFLLHSRNLDHQNTGMWYYEKARSLAMDSVVDDVCSTVELLD
ncbi:hypothetical protein HDU76_006833 [Blyttiomyces sp. JEL0837]|nr:hypothetical protein HDU76_006833 [Blyttiomyces sp. JEL0837]